MLVGSATLLVVLGFSPAARPPALRRYPSFSGTIRCSSVNDDWSALDSIDDRERTIALMDSLKAEGKSVLWKTTRLAPRSVSLQELTQTTKLAPETLDPTAEEFSVEEISSTFFKVLIGATVASGLFAFVSDAAGMDAGMRFTGTYLIAGVPIGVLAIGSLAPGVLFLPFEWFKSAQAKDERRGRVAKHEAAHLLTAHCLGIPVASVSVEQDGPRVVVYDEEMAIEPGRQVSGDALPALAVVALSGLMAEAEAYGKALGVKEDLSLLNQMLMRTTPPLPAKDRQDATRYGALMAWIIIKRHEAAYNAITEALIQGKSLAQCLSAAEAAEADARTLAKA